MFNKSKSFIRSEEETEILRLEGLVQAANEEVVSQKNQIALVKSESAAKKQEYFAQGAAAERKRLLAVSLLPEFKGREAMALKITLSDAVQASPEAISNMIRHTPKATQKSQLHEYMTKLGNPNVGADLDTDYHNENSPLESIAKGVL